MTGDTRSVDNQEIRRQNIEILAREAGNFSKLAMRVGMAQSQLSQSYTGARLKSGKRRRITDDTARDLEKGMGKPSGWMDVPHFETREPAAIWSDPVAESAPPALVDLVRQHAYARFPLLRVEAAAGEGRVNGDHPDVIGGIEIAESALYALLGTRRAQGIQLFNVHGDSMVPALNPRDVLFVDTQQKHFAADGIYVFVHDGATKVKRLQHLGADRVRVISDNPAYQAYDIAPSRESFHIVGRVLRALPIQMKEFA